MTSSDSSPLTTQTTAVVRYFGVKPIPTSSPTPIRWLR